MEVDPAAFHCGLDLSTLEVIERDRANITGWREKAIGCLSNSILFRLKCHPEFVKMNRAKWEVAIKALSNQKELEDGQDLVSSIAR